MGPHALHLPLV